MKDSWEIVVVFALIFCPVYIPMIFMGIVDVIEAIKK
jgi:hypothetical protein